MAMQVPKRLLLLQSLTDYYERVVRENNGYQHTLKGRVIRGRLRVDSKDQLPLISLLDNLDPDRFPPQAGRNGAEHVVQKEEYILLVQGWAHDDACHPTDPAHYLMADVRKATAALRRRPHADPFAQDSQRGGGPNPDYLLGGLLTGLTMEPGVVRPPMENVSEKAFFFFRLRLEYVEDPNDPYATGES